MFYFILVEKQSETRLQPFNIADYKGTANLQQLNALADRLRSQYQYEPGSFLENTDELDANRFVAKIDWNPSATKIYS